MPTAALVWAVASLIISIGSATHSIIQAKKQKEAAKRAADARRGYEIPIEGVSTNLTVCYGRVLIGGARVYHNSTGSFTYVTPNANKIFLSGVGTGGVATEYQQVLPRGVQPNPMTVQPGYNQLTSSKDGKKNEMLYFQQALCQGPIAAIHDVVVDEARFLDDPTLGTDVYKSAINDIEGALRVDAHYNGGADDIMAANFGERSRATFDDIAYISVAARLDRFNPQFSGTPEIQCFIEGKLVRTIIRSVGYVAGYQLGKDAAYYGLNTTFAYSNNSALVLLDYLLDDLSGKNLDVSEINLESFYNIATLCSTTVMQNVVTAGKIYQSTDGIRNITTRDVPLYECNMIVDTKRTIRENVETILATMGDARLVWSQGQYVLNAQYPIDNDDIDYSLTITDDVLEQGQEVEISWPSTADRLNFCLVRFNNEAENFKEDTVSWPPKLDPSQAQSETYYIGLGGKRYPPGVSGNGWDDKYEGSRLLNNYAVWNGNAYTTQLDYKFIIYAETQAASLDIEYTADDHMSFTLYEITSLSPYAETQRATGTIDGTEDRWKHVYDSSFSVTDGGTIDAIDRIYRLVINATDKSGETKNSDGSLTKGRGAAFRILNGTKIVWSTRESGYSSFIEKSVDNSVYRTYLAEDNGLELETDLYLEGTTDYYHALAKAEEVVRTSRGTFNMKLRFRLTTGIPEPGDFVKVQSNDLNLGVGATPLYCRVNSVRIDDNFICEATLSRFDYTFLAWNVADNEAVSPAPIYEFNIQGPSNVNYGPNNIPSSSGTLYWDHVRFSGFSHYAVYAHTSEDTAAGRIMSNNMPVFMLLGTTTEEYFELPQLNAYSAFFGVRAVHQDGRTSAMTITNPSIDDQTGIITYTAVVLSNAWINGRLDLTPASEFTTPVQAIMGGWGLEDGLLTNSSTTTTDIDHTGNIARMLQILGDGTNASTYNSWYGLWQHDFLVEHPSSYISYAWIKRKTSNSTHLKLGWTPDSTSTGDYIKTLAGATATDPWFVDTDASLTVDKWYLVAGIIHTSDYTGADIGTAGVYDPDDGTQIIDGTEFKNSTTATRQALRIGFNSNGSTLTSADGFIIQPGGTYVIDGTQPTLDSMFGMQGPPGDPGIGITTHLSTGNAVTLWAFASGHVSNYTDGNGTFSVYENGVVTSSGNTFGIVGGTPSGGTEYKSQNGLRLTINTSTGAYALTGDTNWLTPTRETFVMTATRAGLTYSENYAVSKITSGYEMGTTLTSDDDASNFDGWIFFQTSDRTLWIYRGSPPTGAWERLIDTASAGVVTNEMLAGAIEATKFASNIEPVTLVNGVPGTQTSGNVIYDTVTLKIYRWDTTQGAYVATVPGGDVTSGISASNITVGQIQTGQIAAGAIKAGQIDAGAVTADKLYVGEGRGASLTGDPSFKDATAWTVLGSGNFLSNISWGKVGTTMFQSDSYASIYSKRIPIDTNKTYRVRCWAVSGGGANGTLYTGLALQDGNGTNISGSGTYWYLGAVGAGVPTGWTEYVGIIGPSGTPNASLYYSSFTNGTNAKTMELIALVNYGGTVGQIYIQDLRVEEVIPGTLIQGGTITTNHISTGGLNASVITTGSIAANVAYLGSITSANIGTNQIVAYEGNIATLTVDTLHVKNSAISGSYAQYISSATYMAGPYGGYQTYVDLVLNGTTLQWSNASLGTSTDKRVIIWFAASAYRYGSTGENLRLRCVRSSDGQAISGNPLFRFTADPYCYAFTFVDSSPNASTMTYKMQVAQYANAGSAIYIGRWYDATITGTVLKK